MFIGETQPFLLGMQEMSIVDLVAFFAILGVHKDWIESEEAQRICPKLQRWSERLMDNQDLFEFLQTLKLDASAIKEAKQDQIP